LDPKCLEEALLKQDLGIIVVDVNYLRLRMGEVWEAIRELDRLSSKPYGEMSVDEKYSMRYQVVVLAEALGAICLHIAMDDLGFEPSSYSECFSILEEHGVITCAKDLVSIARLRNLLVHRYWLIDDSKVYEHVKRNFGCVRGFLERIGDRYGIR